MSGHGSGHGSHDEHEGHLKAATGALVGVVAHAATRGLALFLGAYTVVGTLATTLTKTSSDDLWWIDLSFLPQQAALWFGIACSVTLIAYALAPMAAKWRQWLTVAACGALAAAALENIGKFYRAWGAGDFQPGFALPFCIIIAVLFALLAWAVLAVHSEHVLPGDHVAMVVGFGLMLVVFPLLVTVFYGSSDYRSKADAAVVFGGRVRDDGSLSPALRDRVLTAADVYKAGLVDTLVFSGGAGTNGIEQAGAMRKYAVKHGVPASAILLDNRGDDLDASISNTADMFSRYGFKKVLAVNQGYRLARIKLEYLAHGWDIGTVPAEEAQANFETPMLAAKETPAFWQYWVEVVLGSFQKG